MTAVKPPWVPTDPGPRFHRVVRWDNVVHIVAAGLPGMIRIDNSGRVIEQVTGEGIRVTLICGRHAKLHYTSKNRFTERAATCLACVAGEFT